MDNQHQDLERDSVIIELDRQVQGQESLVLNLMSISAGLQLFLLNVINASKKYSITPKYKSFALDEGSKIITRVQLQKFILDSKEGTRGASDALISRRLSELAELKVCSSKVYAGAASREKYYHHRITDLSKLASLKPIRSEIKSPAKRRTKSLVMIQREFFQKDEQAIFLRGHKDLSVHIHQQIFNGILDSAMRLSHKDTRREIEVDYQIVGKPLVIKALCSSSHDSGIAILTDQRAMRPIVAFCKKEIARRKVKLQNEYGSNYLPSMVPNIFRLDIHDLCDLMGMKPHSENIDLAVAMMRRLADTTFIVDASKNDWFKDNFSMMPGSNGVLSDVFEFRFLQNLEIAREHVEAADLFGKSPGDLRPRFYTFSLEIRLFYSLVMDDSATLFISHQELSAEQSGILHRLYNWARFWVSGRERPQLAQKWYSLTEMHEKLTPAARLDNFRVYFIRALAKKAVGEFKQGVGGVSLVYGYFVYYERRDGGDFFRFERDKDDYIVGDNSKHNVLTRQSLLEQFQSE